MIVPKAKGSKWRGNKTDTIIISHVDLHLLHASVRNLAGVIDSACDPTERALRVAGCGGRQYAGAGQCLHLAGTNAVRLFPARVEATDIICESDLISRGWDFMALRSQHCRADPDDHTHGRCAASSDKFLHLGWHTSIGRTWHSGSYGKQSAHIIVDLGCAGYDRTRDAAALCGRRREQ